MSFTEEILAGIYLIGGPNVSHSEDATSFLVDCETDLVMIDTGAGQSATRIEANIRNAGYDPDHLAAVILTHCHIDHIGGAPHFVEAFGCSLVAHDLDADAIETGDPLQTASHLYGTDFPPTPIDIRLTGEENILSFGGLDIRCIHTPGHTPGSISICIERDGKRILFGQDVHGPFLKAFRSDIGAWKESMARLLELDADILCEGHFGIFKSKEKVRSYIESYLKQY
ncbi:MAG: MBL fold metallo-hydrolase [Syntrophales bacterium]|nr:MBL fold metallo-hydrolase [Syntrophales bacterium]